MKYFSAKIKEEWGSARAFTVGVAMDKVYCSQFKVYKDSLLLDEILLAFIKIDIEGKRLPRIIPLSYLMRPDL